MYKKSWKIYFVSLFFITIFLVFLFCPKSSTTVGTENVSVSYFGLVIKDFSVFAAFFAGILAFAGALYTSNRNFKAIKLSSIPDNSMNLLLDLEFLFNEYELSKKEGNGDEFKLLIQILEYWKDHQKAFLLITPHFYKKFLRLITDSEVINDEDKIYEKNSKYVINAILAYISNSALENNECPFIFIIPNLINDNLVIEEIGDISNCYVSFEFNKNNLLKYMNEIHGKNTKEHTSKKFKKLNLKIKSLLVDLKEEMEEYYGIMW